MKTQFENGTVLGEVWVRFCGWWEAAYDFPAKENLEKSVICLFVFLEL